MFKALVSVILLVGSTALVSTPMRALQSPASSARATETALDRYVATPDPRFGWEVVADLPAAGVTATLLNVTSQQWLTPTDVDQPIWRHWVTVIRPPAVRSDVALLFITGSSSTRPRPAAPPAELVQIARSTGTVVVELRLVPNQPLVFLNDPAKKPRSEDDTIAYTWAHYLRTGDERWPLQLPMTKSAVRTMDAVTAFAASPAGGGLRVERFVVAGASKRGWTTWLTAAVDRRVVAIAPVVIDVLNLPAQTRHHWRAYGAWAEAIQDYVDHRIMDWLGTPRFDALMRLVEPFSYRSRMTMPKLLINASGDEFFLPDSSQFYFSQLPGESRVRYVPNAGHSLAGTDAFATLLAFHASIVESRARPSFTWTFEPNGVIRVVSKNLPKAVVLWQATNPTARDFRMTTIDKPYHSTPLQPVGPNTWVGTLATPERGWTAGFIELTFDAPGSPMKLTTAVRVVPETLPHGEFSLQPADPRSRN